MSKYVLICVSSLITAILAACGSEEGSPKPTAAVEAPAPSPQGSTGAAPANAKVRITLDASGNIALVEGVSSLGLWEPSLGQQEDSPQSLGDAQGSIQVYSHDGSLNELEDSTGGSAHSHAQMSHGALNAHCHRWLKSGSTYYLVHC